MTSHRDLLDHAVELFPAPDQALLTIRRRHQRRQRNRRLAAGGVGLAITIAIVAVAVGITRSTEPIPLDEPPLPLLPTVSEGKVLYVILRNGKSVPSYIDSTGLHRITTMPDRSFYHLVWASPTEIVFDGTRDDGRRHLYRMTIEGRDIVQLTHGSSAQLRPAISPDGSLVAYDQFRGDLGLTDDGAYPTKAQYTGKDMGIHLADAADGSDPRPLLPASERPPTGYDTSPTFSPDGRWIAFTRVKGDPYAGGADPYNGAAIYIVRTNGTGLQRLTDPALNAAYPRWSPDGSTILFQGMVSGPKGQLWTVPVGGGDATALTDHGVGGHAFEADWSPDGSQIVFKYWDPTMSPNELRVIDADGSGERRLWTGHPQQTAETPDWSS